MKLASFNPMGRLTQVGFVIAVLVIIWVVNHAQEKSDGFRKFMTGAAS